MIERACENCRFSRPVSGLKEPTLICEHKADAEDKWVAVDASGRCSNFEASRDVLSAELADALAEGAKLIPLTQDKFAIVDAADYDRLSKHKWCAVKGRRTYYATRRANGKLVRMHRVIMKARAGQVVDHKYHDGLDNRRCKLRFCTPRQNTMNQRPRLGCSSEYKGVFHGKGDKKFIAGIAYNSKRIHLGRFDTARNAAKAYDKKAKELFGEFAYLNFPED